MKFTLPRPALLAVLALLLWPLLLLAPCLFGSRTFLPYDLAQFPPASIGLEPAQVEEVRAGNNLDATEIPVWVAPELKLARQELLDGSLPEWNPYARSGTVLLAHGADGLLYPPNWLALLCAQPEQALGWLALLNYLVGAVLCFGLLREHGCSHLAAVFGALCFCASATAFANGPYYMRLAALMWLPGLLWSLRRSSQKSGLQRVPSLCAFAACLALTWLAGFPPYSVGATLVALGYAVWLGLAGMRGPGFRKHRSFLPMVLAATAAGMWLCAMQLLPLLCFFPDSARETAPGLAHVSRSAFDWYGFLGYLVPDLFGRPDVLSLPYERSPLPLLLGRNTEWGGKPLLPTFNATEYAIFPGSLGLPMAVIGAAFGRGRGRAFALTALLVLWGLATFAIPFAYLYVLPGLRAVTPLRFLGPASLMVAWLAALGLDAVRAEGRRWLPMAAALTMTMLALLALWFASSFSQPDVFQRWHLADHAAVRYAHLRPAGELTADWVSEHFLHSPPPEHIDFAEQGRLRARAACLDVVPWCFVFAALLGCLAIPWRDRRWHAAAAAAAVALAASQQYCHRHPWLTGIEPKHPASTMLHEWLARQRAQARDQGGFAIARGAVAPGEMQVLPPGQPYQLGVRDLNAYTYFDRWSSQAMLALFGKDGKEAVGKGYLEWSVPDALLEHPLLDLLGVRYVVSLQELQHAGSRVGPELRGPGGECFVYERPHPLPRAFVVPELRAVADDAAAAAAVADPAFDPRSTAVVPAAMLSGEPGKGEPASAGRTVRFVQDRAGEITLAVGAGKRGFLVLADSWLPGWSALLLPDTPLEILRADGGLRAVELSRAEACEIRFRYRTPGLRPGLWLSALAAIALLAALLAAWLGGGHAGNAPAPVPARE